MSMLSVNHYDLEAYNPNFLEIGSLSIAWYAVLILSGAFVALYLGIRLAKRFGIDPDVVYNGFVYGLIFAIIGGRIYYVIFEWSQYQNRLLDIFKIYEGGMAIHGSILTTIVFVYFYTKKHSMDLFVTIEMVTPGFLLAQAIGRWGNFMNQEAHGPLVPGANLDEQRAFLSQTLRLPKFIVDQMFINKPYLQAVGYYHPTFFYESMWNVTGVLILFGLRKWKKYWIGDAIAYYLIWYSIGRFFIEGMRTDSLYIGGIRVAQLISVVLILVGIAVLVLRHYFDFNPKSFNQALAEAIPFTKETTAKEEA